MQNKNINPCKNCAIKIQKQEECLHNNESAFGAAAELYFFIIECKKTCKKAEDINKGENID